MNVFISMPMNGFSEREIRDNMEKIFKEYKKDHPSAKLLDSVLSNEVRAYADKDQNVRYARVWCLGESLHILSEADVVLFAPGWEGVPGCRIEQKVATYYDIPMEYVR